jgi:hypothetical protein
MDRTGNRAGRGVKRTHGLELGKFEYEEREGNEAVKVVGKYT